MVRRVPVPLGPRVVVKVVEEQSETGLIVPEGTRTNRVRRGYVVSAGRGWMLPSTDGDTVPMSLGPGDEVLLPPEVGFEFRLDGEALVLCDESHVLCKLVEANEEVEAWHA